MDGKAEKNNLWLEQAGLRSVRELQTHVAPSSPSHSKLMEWVRRYYEARDRDTKRRDNLRKVQRSQGWAVAEVDNAVW